MKFNEMVSKLVEPELQAFKDSVVAKHLDGKKPAEVSGDTMQHAFERAWMTTHPRGLEKIHNELLRTRGAGVKGRMFTDAGYYPKDMHAFGPYLKDWLQRHIMGEWIMSSNRRDRTIQIPR